MTGLDLAFTKGFGGSAYSSSSPEVLPYASKWWQDAFYVLGKPQEWMSKAVGKALSNDPKYDFSRPSNYFNQQSFTTLLADTGMDGDRSPILSTTLGLVLGGFLDPLNYITGGMGGTLTRAGVVGSKVSAVRRAEQAAKEIGSVGSFMRKVDHNGKAVWEISTDAQKAHLDRLAVQALDDSIPAATRDIASSQFNKVHKIMQDTEEINSLLKEYQASGMSLKDIELAPSRWEQARKGQRVLFGMTNPLKTHMGKMLNGSMSALDQAAVTGSPAFLSEGVLRAAGGVADAAKNGVTKLFSMVADKLSDSTMPMVRTQQMRDLSQELVKAGSQVDAKADDIFLKVINARNTIGKDITKEDAATILNSLEAPIKKVHGEEAGQAVLGVIGKAFDQAPDLEFKIGKTVDTAPDLQGLTPHSKLTSDQKLAYFGPAVAPNEIPKAVHQWDAMNVPKSTVGQHPTMLTDDFIIQRPSTPTAQEFNEKYVKGIDGVAQFTKTTAADGGPLLVAKRDLGLHKVESLQEGSKGVLWSVEHSRNLEVAASALSAKGMAITSLSPNDVLVSPHGVVKIINYDSLAPAKNVKSAREISQTALENFFDRMGRPQGPEREFQLLGSDRMAKKVLRSQRDYSVTGRVASANEVGDGVMSAHDIVVEAANMHSHREYVRTGFLTGDSDPLYLAKTTGNPTDFERANNITSHREQIRKQLASGDEVMMKPIELGRHPDGYLYVRDGRDRLTAAILEGLDTVPVKRVDYTGEAVDFSAYFTRDPKSLQELAQNHSDFATQGLKVQFNPVPGHKGAVVNVHPQQALSLAGAKIESASKELVADFTDRLRNGKPVEPVHVFFDLAKNRVTKSDGMWRAKAAQVAGVQDMPMFVTFTRNGKFVSKMDAGEIEQAMKLTRMTDNGVTDVLDNGYKLASVNGDRLLLDRSMLSSGTGGLILNKVGELMGFSSPSGFSPARASNLMKDMVQAAGSAEAAMLRVGEFLANFDGKLATFVDWAKNEMGLPVTGLLRSSSRDQLRNMLTELRSYSRTFMDEMAQKGVFTKASVQDPHYLRQFAMRGKKGDVGGVVESYANGTPTFASGTMSHEDLVKYATRTVHQYGDIESVLPFQQVRTISNTGDQLIEARQMMSGSSRFEGVVPFPNTMKISDELRKELKTEGIYFNPSKEEASLVLNKDTGILAQSKDGKIVRPEMSFFFTKTGGSFISTRGHSISEMLNRVYGEGPVFAAEFGVATREGIFVNNAFNATITKAGTAEVKVMEKRIRELARKFEDLGFSRGTPLDINAGFDPSVWKQIYGDHVTLGDVLKSGWKLDLPPLLRNMPLDVTIDAAHSVVRIEQLRLKNPNLQALFEMSKDSYDQLFIDEMKAGVPSNYIAPYFPRFVTQEGKQALGVLNEKFENFISQSPSIKHNETFLKKRLLSDYTTVDVNNFIKEIRRQKAQGIEPEKIYSTLIDKVANERNYKFFSDLADEMNKIDPNMTVDFFHQDPLLALAYRTRDSVSARTAKAQVDLMAKSGAAWVGTVEEARLLRKGAQGVQEAEDKLAGLVDKLKGAEEELIRTAGYPEIDRMTKDSEKIKNEIDKLKLQRGEQEVQVSNLKRAMRENHGIISSDVTMRGTSAYVSGDEFQKLVEAGLVQEQELTAQVGKSLVEVPLTKYSDMLDKNNVKVMLFTDEARPLALKYFGSMDQTTGFPKVIRDFWDHYQDMWRTWTLLPIPAYHVRNAFSNLYMMWLGGFKDLESLGTSHQMFALLNRYKKGQIGLEDMISTMKETKFVNDMGGVADLQQVYQEFIANGGMMGHLHLNEFSRFTGGVKKNSEFITKGVQNGIIPSSEMTTSLLMDNKLLQGGRSIGMHIENVSRFATFVDAWKRMGDFTAASLHMKSVLYDYNNLSLFERNMVRRVFPFYAWSRQNIPRMLETVLTDPMKHYKYARWVTSWEQAQLDGRKIDADSEMPEWLRHSMLLGKDKQGNWVLKTVDGFIPTYELFQMFENPKDYVGSRVTPFLKFPIEQIVNRSFQTGKQLEKYPGEPAQGWTLRKMGFTAAATTQGPLGILNMVANESLFNTAFRPGKVVTRAIDALNGGESTESMPLNFLAGVVDLFIGRAMVRDPNELKAQVYSNWQRTQTTFLNAARRAEATGNDEAASQLRKLLLDLEVRKPTK